MPIRVWLNASAVLADAVWRLQVPGSILKLSIRLGAAVVLCAAPLLSSETALAQFAQQGSKLVGSPTPGNAHQGGAVALSADGNTAIVGGFGDTSGTGAAWVYTRSGGTWTQQGKLVGTGAAGSAEQGISVALSADGNTAIVGGFYDNTGIGAAWIFTRSAGVWSQQGSKLVGTSAVGAAAQGWVVALSGDGNTAAVSGWADNSAVGATWVFTRSGTVWSQQGSKLVGTGAVGSAGQGHGVALSADGNTLVVGGNGDNSGVGAAWVFTRSGGVWSQQGNKLVGTGAVGAAAQGWGIALSSDGNTAIVGGLADNSGSGAAWAFTRSGSVWSQQGSKLVATGEIGNALQGQWVGLSGDGNIAIIGSSGDGAWLFTRSGSAWTQQGSNLYGTGAVGNAEQGVSVGLSADGSTAIVGGDLDGTSGGAAWVFVQSPQIQQLQVTPATNIATEGPSGGPFSTTVFQYQISTTSGSFNYSIDGIPTWLNASFTSGTATTSPITDTFTLTNVSSLDYGVYTATISFTNTTNGSGSTTRTAILFVRPEIVCVAMTGQSPETPDAAQSNIVSDLCAKSRSP